MGIFLGDTAPSKIFVGSTQVSKVFVGDTKVRPTVQPITTAGIYHSADLGLISLSSNGSTWLTIADKNLGATSTDITSTNSYGNYYQRGNNYGWLYGATYTVSSSTVNASTYGPGNYYSDSTYRNTGENWDSSGNRNLWGGTTGTNAARQGPCPTDFHVPSAADMTNLLNIGVALGALSASSGSGWWNYLLLPKSGGNLQGNGAWSNYNIYSALWTSDDDSADYGKLFMVLKSEIRNTQNNVKTAGQSIRPFKNTPVQPDSSWIVLYQ